jgi:transcriptional regulator with XRE-family HTH domain
MTAPNWLDAASRPRPARACWTCGREVAVRRAREVTGMSQLELAKRAKVAQGYISDPEAGAKKNPGIDVLKRLARALGVPVTALLE